MKKSIDFREQQWWKYLLATLILLPLLWLNTRNSQHWGDDFAVYIQQAINISEGKPFDASGYYILPGFNSLVPSAPIGFSFLLIPIHHFAGLHIYPYILFQSMLYVAWALLSFFLVRKHFSLSTSLLFLFVAWYPNFMLWLKLLLTSDIAFSLMIMLVCLLLHPQKISTRRWFLSGILLGFAIITRTVGFVFVPAALFFALYRQRFKGERILHAKSLIPIALAMVVLPFAIYFGSAWLFPGQTSYLGFTLKLIKESAILTTFVSNLSYHLQCYRQLFESSDPSLATLSHITGFWVLLLTCAGMILRTRQPLQFFDFAALGYLLFIIFYPITTDYRYLVPVHVMLLYYFFVALKALAQRWTHPSRAILKPALLVLFAFIYYDHLYSLACHSHETVEGPYEESAQETFAAIKKLVPDGETIFFNKPRALALFTGKKTTYWNLDADAGTNYKALRKAGVNYFLLCSSMQNGTYKDIIQLHRANMLTVYDNHQFALLLDTVTVQ